MMNDLERLFRSPPSEFLQIQILIWLLGSHLFSLVIDRVPIASILEVYQIIPN
jgi:hypothetical protein